MHITPSIFIILPVGVEEVVVHLKDVITRSIHPLNDKHLKHKKEMNEIQEKLSPGQCRRCLTGAISLLSSGKVASELRYVGSFCKSSSCSRSLDLSSSLPFHPPLTERNKALPAWLRLSRITTCIRDEKTHLRADLTHHTLQMLDVGTYSPQCTFIYSWVQLYHFQVLVYVDMNVCASHTHLRGEQGLILEQSLTQRLLIQLVDICKAQNLFFVSCCKVKKGLIARTKVLVVACDQQHTVSVERLHLVSLSRQSKDKTTVFMILIASSRKTLWSSLTFSVGETA